jgi:hypothetical protein
MAFSCRLTMPEPAELPVHCPLCGGAVQLHLEDWPDNPSEAQASAQCWTCPYCRKTNQVEMPGRIVLAIANYREIKTRH